MSGPWKLRGYVVEELLGRGGCADVWRARASGSGAPVALKRIALGESGRAQRAQAEAALLCALDHPHLVRLHSMVPTEGSMVLVLDLADGGSLADLLAARGRLTPGEVITAIAPIAAAVAYLHDESVVHGDVTPANILFTEAGVPLLADVGVARLTGDDADAESTPAYVDPAVVVGRVPGPQSDVFMLGGVALHALTGTVTWPADTAEGALALAAHGDADDFSERLARAGVPAAMSAVVSRALSRDPHRRGTAAAFALDLRHSGRPVAVELSAGRPRSGVRAQRWVGPRHAASPVAAARGARPSACGPALPGPEGAGLPAATAVAGNPATESRPAFERPGPSSPAGAEPPTRMVGPRPRPEIPRSRPRRLSRWVPHRPWIAGLAAVLAVAALLVAASRGWGSDAGRSTRPGPRATDWERTLTGLDALRAEAYATRDAHLLRRVYVPGPLLTADTRLLARIVPRGCGLVGARTRYGQVRVEARGATAVVTVRATLSASTLVCQGTAEGAAPGAGPTTLRLTLRRDVGGPRIVAESGSAARS